jgi:hypothetical protein
MDRRSCAERAALLRRASSFVGEIERTQTRFQTGDSKLRGQRDIIEKQPTWYPPFPGGRMGWLDW